LVIVEPVQQSLKAGRVDTGDCAKMECCTVRWSN